MLARIVKRKGPEYHAHSKCAVTESLSTERSGLIRPHAVTLSSHVSLPSSFHYIGDRPGPDLVSFLNSQQAFSILPETHGVLYADGSFFSPDIGTGTNFDPDRFTAGKILTTYAALDGITSEKGDKNSD